MNDGVKGYEGNKGMSQEEVEKRLREAGGLEALGFGSQPLPPPTGRLETDAQEVRTAQPPVTEQSIRADERAKCLRELRPYLGHKMDCPLYELHLTHLIDQSQRCTCGLSALLGEEGGK